MNFPTEVCGSIIMFFCLSRSSCPTWHEEKRTGATQGMAGERSNVTTGVEDTVPKTPTPTFCVLNEPCLPTIPVTSFLKILSNAQSRMICDNWRQNFQISTVFTQVSHPPSSQRNECPVRLLCTAAAPCWLLQLTHDFISLWQYHSLYCWLPIRWNCSKQSFLP